MKYSTKKLLFKWLNRRSQRRSYTWDTFNNGLLRTFPLLEPSIKDNVYEAVKLVVTRPKGADEAEYVKNILANRMAAAVKNSDKLRISD